MDEIQYTEVFAVADAKIRNSKIPQNFGLIKWQNFYGNITSLFSTHFILKLLIKFFQWFAVEIGKTRLLLGWKNNSHVFRSQIKFLEWNFLNTILFKKRILRLHLQYFEIFLKSLKSVLFNEIVCDSSKSIKYLLVYTNISECYNYNIAVKYFAIFEKNIATIFQLQWNIGNISEMFLQYSVLCGSLSVVICGTRCEIGFFSMLHTILFFHFKLNGHIFVWVHWRVWHWLFFISWRKIKYYYNIIVKKV